jgi:hypothetical protein
LRKKYVVSKKKLSGIIVGSIIVIIVIVVIATSTPIATPTPTYTLSVIVNPPQAGSVSPSGGEYESGEQVILTATPTSGYTFEYWEDMASSSSNTVTITMNAHKAITAHFKVVEPSSDCMCYSYTLKRYIPCEEATAICRDGTCSISKSRSGTCSHHGGVARWIE